MTKVVPIKINDYNFVDLSCFPKELENMWVHVQKIKNSLTISCIVSFYKNDDFLPGTVIESSYTYHRYPDAYAMYGLKTELGIYFGVRAYTSPRYRRRGWWKWLMFILRDVLYNNFEMMTEVSADRNKVLENIYKKALNMGNQVYNKYFNDGRMLFPEKEMPRDSGYPYIWYNHRIGGKIKEG
jgi:hypothetical protein